MQSLTIIFLAEPSEFARIYTVSSFDSGLCKFFVSTDTVAASLSGLISFTLVAAAEKSAEPATSVAAVIHARIFTPVFLCSSFQIPPYKI